MKNHNLATQLSLVQDLILKLSLNLSFISLQIFIITMIASSLQAQERDLDVYPFWKYYSNHSNVLYESIAQRAFEQLDDRKIVIDGLQTRNDWIDRQSYVRSTLKDIIGPFPVRTPLNPVVTDTIYIDGMVIEKLYFESRPDYFVTAIFCYPENMTTPLPGILFCSGHTGEGFRSETYQHMIFNYVRKGFAVLAFDPIGQGERIKYLDDQGKPRLGPTKEHSYPGSQAFLAGISPANFFIWDGIRAIDYLLTRDEVDPERLGITGRSGGGTQTAYIAAMDDRLYAAAPECYITTFDKLLKSIGPQDAEQNLMHGIARGIDLPDYIQVRAPKPTLIVSTTRDFFNIQGVRDAFHESQKVFTALGDPDYLQKIEDDAPHQSTKKNREATYAFFRKHLGNPGSTSDEEVPVFSEEELWVTPGGNVYSYLGGEDVFSLAKKYLNESIDYNPRSSNDLRMKLPELTGYESFQGKPEVVFSGRMQFDTYALEKYLVGGAESFYLPVVWLKPHESSGKVIIWLDDEGKNSAGRIGGAVDEWLKSGYSIVLADLSGMGELGGGFEGGDARMKGVPLNVWYAGILTNNSLVGMHAEEISLLRKFVDLYSDNSELILYGKGMVGTEILHAAYMEGWTERMVLIDVLTSYRSILNDREYHPRYLMSSVAGGLSYYDIPDLIEQDGINNKLIINPVDGEGKIVRDYNFGKTYFPNNPEELFSVISGWLK